MSTDPAWFYESGGERVGPVSAEEILTLHRKGSIRADTLVWRDGLGNWIPFSASELAGAGPPQIPVTAAPGPPPVPAVIPPFVPRTAALRSDFRPQLRYSFGRAWALLTSNFWPLVGCFTLTTLILSVAFQFFIPVFFLMYPLMGGLYWYLLQQVRGRNATVEMLFEGFKRQFGALAIVNLIIVGISMLVIIVLVVLIAAGFAIFATGNPAMQEKVADPVVFASFFGGIFLVTFLISLPLMILGQVGNFATLLILDCGLQAKEAMSLAWCATKPFLLKFLLFVFLTTALSLAGMIALYVGMLVTGAWASIALVYLYEDAFGDSKPAQPRIA